MRRAPLILAVLALAAPLAAAQENLAAPGVGARFLNLPSSAAALAQASALGAVPGSLDALGLNPAGLAGLDAPQATFTHSILIEDSSLEHLAAGLGLGGGAGLALGVDYLNYGSVERYIIDAGGNITQGESLRPFAVAFSVGYAQPLGLGLSLGAALKTVTESLDTSASTGLAVDLGAQWRPGVAGLSLGLSALDFGGGLKGAELPSKARLSAAYAFGDSLPLPLRVSADGLFNVADRGAAQAGLGLELQPLAQLALRAGYRLAGEDSAPGAALGAGLRHRWLSLDYAYDFAGDLGPTQRFTFSVALPKAAPAAEAASASAEAAPAPARAAPVTPEAQAAAPADAVPLLVTALQSGDEAALRQSTEAIVAQGPEQVRRATQAVSTQELQPAVFNGELAKAQQAARTLTELDPQNARAYLALGVLSWHQGDPLACLQNLRKAYELDPSRDYLPKMIRRVEAVVGGSPGR